MYKIFFFTLIIALFQTVPCRAESEIAQYYDTFNMEELEQYGDFKTIFNQAMNGDFTYVKKQLNPKKLLLGEIKDSISILKSLIFICLLNGIIASLNMGGGSEKSVGQMSFLVSYLLATGLCMSVIKEVLNILTGFSATFSALATTVIPIISTVLVVSGRTTLGSATSVIMYTACSAMTMFIKTIILPCISFYAVSGMINCLSPQGMLTRLSKLINSFVTLSVKGLGIAFSVVIALEKAISSGSDGIMQKMMVSSVKAVPVVGDVFAVGAEGVMSFMSAIKGGFGVSLILLVWLVCAVPVIKILAITIIFKVTAALSEPLGDSRISAVIDTAGGVSSLVLTVTICLVLVFMGAVAILLCSMGG